MAVSGRGTVPSKQNPNLQCVPCGKDDLKNEKPPHGYCQNCKEHLCETCFQHHRRPKASRDHVLLDKNVMPSPDNALYLQYEKALNLKMPSDDDHCDIWGIVILSRSHLIVADHGNKKIKLIDAVDGTLVTEEMLSSGPYDIIKLPNNQLAVTLWRENCIQIMSYTDKALSLDRRIDVGEKCFCLAYCRGKLVVGCNFDPGKLIILDLDGNVIQTFDTPGLFVSPKKIIISNDEKFLYVTDNYLYRDARKSCNVIKMDWDGNIVQSFSQPGYKGPRGIQELEDGSLLVCYFYSENIVRLSSDFKRCEIVGLEETNIYVPWALAYSEIDHKVYVSCSSKNDTHTYDTIKVFNVKWMSEGKRETRKRKQRQHKQHKQKKVKTKT